MNNENRNRETGIGYSVSLEKILLYAVFISFFFEQIEYTKHFKKLLFA